ncbi:hypothetical protein BD309DRAFT_334224 [Dichomitus squalens]|nr:hypothetical protein BD309DRAFT_334224 [Dichomitus squalens]
MVGHSLSLCIQSVLPATYGSNQLKSTENTHVLTGSDPWYCSRLPTAYSNMFLPDLSNQRMSHSRQPGHALFTCLKGSDAFKLQRFLVPAYYLQDLR